MISIGTLTPQDRPAWEALFRAYNDFYETTLPQDTYDRAWTEFQAGERMHALVARVDGRLAGIVHFLVHPRQRHRPAALRQGGRDRGLHPVRDPVLGARGARRGAARLRGGAAERRRG
jgi:hypothetical protein